MWPPVGDSLKWGSKAATEASIGEVGSIVGVRSPVRLMLFDGPGLVGSAGSSILGRLDDSSSPSYSDVVQIVPGMPGNSPFGSA